MPRHSGVTVDLAMLAGTPQRVRAGVQRTLRSEIGMDLLSEGVRNAPVDEGTLRGSHSLHVGGERVATGADVGASGGLPTPAGGGMETNEVSLAVVANTTYAMHQHETVELVHPKGGEAKWLTNALTRNQQQYARRLGEAAGRAAEGK